MSWLLDIRDPVGSETLDSLSEIGPLPVRSRVEVAPDDVVSLSSLSVPFSRMAGHETKKITFISYNLKPFVTYKIIDGFGPPSKETNFGKYVRDHTQRTAHLQRMPRPPPV
jgi:hypothetical protein